MGGWSEDGVVAEVSMAMREQGLGGENLREHMDGDRCWLPCVAVPHQVAGRTETRGLFSSFHPRLGNG